MRLTPVTNHFIDALLNMCVEVRGVIQMWVVAHQYIIQARLLHCRHLVVCPLEVPGDLQMTAEHLYILETCTGIGIVEILRNPKEYCRIDSYCYRILVGMETNVMELLQEWKNYGIPTRM